MVAGAYSVYSQSESDDDDYLAAAVAAADAKQGKAKKVKHRHLKALRSKLGSISRGKDKEGSGSISGASPTSEQVCACSTDKTVPVDACYREGHMFDPALLVLACMFHLAQLPGRLFTGE